MGADYIEQDVVLSRDGVPLVLHDIHLDAVTNVARVYPGRAREDGRYYAADFDLEELRELRLRERMGGDGQPRYPGRFPPGWSRFGIATLAEEIELIQGLNRSRGTGTGLYTEIKSPAWHRAEGLDISAAVLETLTHYGYGARSDEVYIQCFDPAELKRIRSELGSDLKLVQLIGENEWNEAEADYEVMRSGAGLREIARYADGIGPATRHFFGKHPRDVGPVEAAYLASLRRSSSASKVIFLLSDGDWNRANYMDPSEASDLGVQMGVRIFTVLVGREDSRFPFGATQYAVNPELLKIPLETVRGWLSQSEPLRLYTFAIEDLYRQQEHVLDEEGERLMSLSSRLASSPNEAYFALSTADAKFPKITLSSGEEVTVSYGQYRAILSTRREQSDREKAFRALYETYNTSLNTYATLYNAVCQRDWFNARARGYASTLEAALHGDNIPTTVVENLIETTRDSVEPLRRYHRVRRRALGLETYQVYDFSIPIVEHDKKYPYDDVLDWIVEAVSPLGPEYQARMREGFTGRWVDVYENEGKRSGAYSAPVYGTHPYMLMNYTDTLDDVFTMAHEMGHSMHTILSHETQPFIYSGYTIFVAEVPSTLSEALLLDLMLERSTDARLNRGGGSLGSTGYVMRTAGSAGNRRKTEVPPASRKRTNHFEPGSRDYQLSTWSPGLPSWLIPRCIQSCWRRRRGRSEPSPIGGG